MMTGIIKICFAGNRTSPEKKICFAITISLSQSIYNSYFIEFFTKKVLAITYMNYIIPPSINFVFYYKTIFFHKQSNKIIISINIIVIN